MSNVTDHRPPTSQPVPDLVRPRDDRVVAGVASGIARRLGIGPGWVRIGFILLLFLGGLGLLAYGIGWLAIRDEGAAETILDDWVNGLQGSTAWIGAGLVVLAGMILLSATDVISGNLVFAAGLFLAGLLLYRGRFPTRSSADAPPPVPAPDEPPPRPSPGDAPSPAGVVDTVPASTPALPDIEGTTHGAAFGPAGGGERTPPPPAPVPIDEQLPPPAPPREPSYLGRLTVAAVLVTLGTMAVFDNLDLASPQFRHYTAAAVLVTGIGLLVGAFVGKARGLVVLGFLLLPVMLFSSVVRIDIFGEYAERIERPAAVTDLEGSYELSGGRLLIDLRDLDAADFAEGAPPVTIDASVGMGELEVRVPPMIDVEVTTEVGIGRIEIRNLDEPTILERAGFGLEATVSADAEPPDLVLDLEVGAGNLEIELR